jgi:hypothetical protein
MIVKMIIPMMMASVINTRTGVETGSFFSYADPGIKIGCPGGAEGPGMYVLPAKDILFVFI